jgi:hypothetical protein
MNIGCKCVLPGYYDGLVYRMPIIDTLIELEGDKGKLQSDPIGVYHFELLDVDDYVLKLHMFIKDALTKISPASNYEELVNKYQKYKQAEPIDDDFKNLLYVEHWCKTHLHCISKYTR